MLFYRYCIPALFIYCLALFLLPFPSISADMTGACHCFRNRTFNPATPFSSDEYLLTTVFNSLLASHFNVSKRQIVMMKMQDAVTNTDLLIGLYIAALSGTDVSGLLELKEKKPWQDMLKKHPDLITLSEADDILRQIRSGIAEELAADHITQGMINNRFTQSSETVLSLKASGLSAREIVVVLTLADHSGAGPGSIFSQYRKNGRSWSEIAHNFGLTPPEVGRLLTSSPQ